MFCITAKIQIVPAIEDRLILLQTMRAYSKACNYVAEYIFQTHNLKQPEVQKHTYKVLRDLFGLRSQMAISVTRTVIARYKTIRTNQKEWIKPNFKHPELDLVWNRDYTFKANTVSVNTLAGRIKMPYFQTGMAKYFDGTWKFGTSKLVTKHGKWFLHIPVSKDIPECPDTAICNVVGIDLGINFIATSYDSAKQTTFYHGRLIKYRRAQYKKTRSELQRRQTPSARRRLKAIGNRENRWMQDVNHCVSKALVKNATASTLFAIEDLTGVRSATERIRLKDRYVMVSWAFYDLRQKLTYKAWQAGSKVIAFDPAYTSQACPICGHTQEGNRNKKAHKFECKNCHYKSNDDRIGAMNLHRKGIEYLVAVTSE